jgi:hypothetical protein
LWRDIHFEQTKKNAEPETRRRKVRHSRKGKRERKPREKGTLGDVLKQRTEERNKI